MPFAFHRLEIAEVIVVESTARRDDRGFFLETYKRSEFAEAGIVALMVQINHSRSVRAVLRGLHYQNPPRAQGKLVGVTQGEIFDVAVDIRRGSPTFGRWVGERLTEGDGRMLWVPEGFAHGFCVLSETADVVYAVTDEYSAEREAGVRWDDPEIDVQWPVDRPVVSQRDAELPLLRDADVGFVFEG